MDPIAGTAIVGVALTLLVPSLLRLPSERRRFQRMDDRKLIDTKVTARMMRGVMITIAFLGPVPFAFIVGSMKDPFVAEVMICAMIAVTLCGIMGFWLFFEMARLATTELELRKFHKEKEETEIG